MGIAKEARERRNTIIRNVASLIAKDFAKKGIKIKNNEMLVKFVRRKLTTNLVSSVEIKVGKQAKIERFNQEAAKRILKPAEIKFRKRR